jgi:HTH-type transcriptional regulator / antitoxin HigA
MNSIKPIRNDNDLEIALRRLRQLWDHQEGTSEADEFEVLAILVHAYEEEHYPIPPPDPISALRFTMEQKGLRPKDLIPYFGASSRVAEVLAGRRRLTLEMVRRLHDGLGIPYASLLGESQHVA